MRDEPALNHQCPVEDGDELLPGNAEAVQIFRQAEKSAVQVAAENKTFVYLRRTEIEALMRIHDIPDEERAVILEKVLICEQISNEIRPNRPKKERA